MDSEEDLTPRYLLRGILNNDLLGIRSPVTRRTSAEAQRSRNSERLSAGLKSDSGAQSTRRSTRQSARLRSGAGAPTLTPQEALRRSLKQKLCESTARTSLPGSNRKTTAKVPVQPAATSGMGSSRASTRLSDFPSVTLPAADQSERALKRKRPPRIIDITAFEKRLNQESAVSLGEAARKEPAMPTASAIICGISPSSGQSELDLSYVPMPATDQSVRGLRRKIPRRILNVSAFEERLSQDTDGRASPSPTASTTLSGVTLSLKTPHTGARTEKKALQRRAPHPHQFSVEAFEEGVLSQTVGNSDGGGSRVFSKAARSNDFTLNLSDAEPECTIDFFNHATTLYAQSSVMGATIPITATKDRATVMVSRIQRDTGDEADGEISQDEEMEVECSKLIRRQSSSYPPAEGGEDVSVESQPEEEDAAAHSQSDEGASQTEDEAVEVQHGVESQPEGEEAESLPEDAAVSQMDEEAHDQSEKTPEEEPGSQTDEEEEPEAPESLPEGEEAESLPEDTAVSTDEEAHESQTGDQLDEAPEVEPGSQTDEEEPEAPESQTDDEEVPVDQMEEEAVPDSQSEEDNGEPQATIEGTPRQPSRVSGKLNHRSFRSEGGGRMSVAVEGRRDYRSMGAVPKAPEVEPGSQTDEEEPEAPESQTDDEEVPVDQMEEEAVPDSQSEEEDNGKPEATIEGTPRQPLQVSGKLNHRAFPSEGGGRMSVAVEGRRDYRSMGAVPKAPEVEPGSQTDEEEPEAPESQTDDEEVPVDQMEEEAVPDSQSEEEDNGEPQATIEGTPRQPSRVSGKLNHRAFRSEVGGRMSVAVEGRRDYRSMGAVPKAPEVEPGSQTDEEEPEAPESQTDDEEVPVDQMEEEEVPDSQSEEDNGEPQATIEGTPRQPSRVSGKLNHRAFRSEGGGRMPVAVEDGRDRRSMRAVPKATEAEWTGNESAEEGPSKRHSGPHLTCHVSGTSAQIAGDLADQEEWEDEENDHEPEDLSMKTPAFVRAIRKGVVTKPQSSPTVLRDIQPSVEDAVSVKPKKRTAKTGGEKKKETPSIFTKSYCMGNFKHFAKTKVSTDVYPVLKETMEKFFDRMVEDLETYANHAKRKTIEVEDVVLLLKRQGHVTDKVPVEVLIEKYLDMSARKELIPCASSGNVVFPKSLS